MTHPSLVRLLAAVAIAAIGSGGCKYDPHPKDGALRCGPGGECPDGYTCLTSTGFCWSNGNSGPTSVLGCDGRTTFAANAQVVRSCILRVGCSPYQPLTSISDCVTLNTQNAAPGAQCNLKSTTCADFQKCEGFGIAGSDLCSTQGGGRCVGSKAVNCDNTGTSTSYFIDCAAAGGTCQIKTGAGATAVADCRVVSSCTETDDRSHCSENYSYACVSGTGYGFSCGAKGYCYAPDGGCYLLGSSSCSIDSETCRGNVREICATPDLFKYDCASVGLGCGPDSAGGTWCLAPGCTAADYKGRKCVESCSGTELTLCYGGVPYTVNCQNYGFSTCFDGLSAPNLTSYATCAN